MPSSTSPSKSVTDILAERFIQSLEKGVAPWQQPWIAVNPCNGESKRPYSGFNLFVLGLFGGDDYFFTARQVKSLGGTLPSRKSVPIRFCKRMKRDKKDKDGKDSYFFLTRFYTVWAAKDCNIPADRWKRPESKGCEFSPIEQAEALAGKSACPVGFGGSEAFFVPAEFRIQMPNKDSFKSPSHYYAVLFHEIGHSLKKDCNDFGKESYAKEELVAELFASLCLSHCGLLADGLFDNSASYVGTWLKRIKDEPSLIIQAAMEAGRRFDRLTKVEEEGEGEGEEEGGE